MMEYNEKQFDTNEIRARINEQEIPQMSSERKLPEWAKIAKNNKKVERMKRNKYTESEWTPETEEDATVLYVEILNKLDELSSLYDSCGCMEAAAIVEEASNVLEQIDEL